MQYTKLKEYLNTLWSPNLGTLSVFKNKATRLLTYYKVPFYLYVDELGQFIHKDNLDSKLRKSATYICLEQDQELINTVLELYKKDNYNISNPKQYP